MIFLYYRLSFSLDSGYIVLHRWPFLRTLLFCACLAWLCLQVSNRRAWADPHHLTPELLALYRRPLHVQGWDTALIEASRSVMSESALKGLWQFSQCFGHVLLCSTSTLSTKLSCSGYRWRGRAARFTHWSAANCWDL